MQIFKYFLQGMCGLIITALFLGSGVYLMNDDAIYAEAALNDDLATIKSKLDEMELREKTIDEEFSNLPYIKSENLVVKAIVEDNVAVSAKTNINGSVDVTYDGYTPITVVGFKISDTSAGDGTKWTYCSLSDFYVNVSSNIVYYAMRNRASDNAKVKFTAYVLYVKNL